MSQPAYDLHLPAARTTGVIFASPHSGRDYPEDFLAASVLDARTIRSSEDAFVDRLFAAAPAAGAPLLCARAPRAYVDLNRAADEFDPAVIDAPPRAAHNPRIHSGLGVIPRVVANGRAIYRGKIGVAEAEARLARYWRPYHARLASLMEESRRLFGLAVLVDCHSMPREAIESYCPAGRTRPEVVLGDRFGAAAAPEIVERIEAAFAAEGFRVARNAPFAGAYIAQAYGRPAEGRHVIQVEIDRALYMDEARIAPLPRFAEVEAAVSRAVAAIAGIGRIERPLAAE